MFDGLRLPLQAFAASLAPHWLDGAKTTSVEELFEILEAKEI